MNKIFKVIWSKSKQCYIVVSEIAKNKTGKKKIVVASILVALAMQSGMIADVMAADPPSAKLADAALAVGTNGVAIGSSAKSQSNQSVAIGYFSNAQAPSASPENPATAVGAGANANGAGTVALGLSANATGANAVALGGGSNGGKNKTEATAVETTAVGFNAKASNSRAAAIGSGAGASGSDSIAMGTSTVADSEKAIAIGANSKGTAIGATALGRDTEASGASATALGALASAKGSTATAVGMQASASGTDSVAVGKTASATNNRALAVGTNAKATGENSVAVGSGAGGSGALGFAGSLNSTAGVVNTIRTINYATTADGDNAVALGFYANAKNSGVAVGQNALAATGGVAIGKGVLEDTGNNLAGGVVMGQDSATLGPYSLAMGFNAFASGSTSMAVGHTVSAQGAYAVAMGRKVSATGTSTAIGHHATATNGGLAIGSQENDASNDRTTASAKGAIAIGKNTKATSEDAVAIGTNAEANRLYSVALGSGSTTATGATNQGSTTINGITYNFAGATGNPNMQVSVGNTGATRQIKNVAAGEVSATSTDAINGSQLYAVASAVKPLKYVSINSTATGTGSNVDNDGAQAPNSIAIGPSSTVTNQNSVALGNNAQSLSDDSIAIGRNAKAESGSVFTNTSRAIAIGSNSRVATNVVQGIAIGSGSLTDEGAVVTGDQSIAIGGNVKVDGHAAIAIGGDDARKAAGQQVSYTNTNDNEVTGTLQTAILNLTGYNLSNYKGTAASHAGVAYGTSALAGNAGVAIGTASDSMTRMNDKGQVVNNKPVTNAVAIGTGARANFDNSVAIGGGSNTDHYATKQVNAVIDGVEVKWSGGENISPGDVVSFGAKGFERQLKNVAPGEVSQTSTDAVNGSQIYSLARKVTNIMNGGSGSVVNVNATGEPLSKVVTGTGASKVEKYYRTVDVKDDGTLVTGAVAQTPTSLALVNVDQTDTNKQTQTPRILGNVANGVKDNDAVNVSQLNAAKVKYFSVNSTDAGNINNDGATGTDAIAIGPSAVSNAVGSVALGKDAKANGDFTVALGGGNWQFKGAQANGVGTTALGSSTKTKVGTNYQTAIGFGATTSAESALALGYNAAASAQNAIALGRSASTAGQDAVALGSSSQAKGDSGLAIGNGAQANSNSVISLGYQANNGASNNTYGVAIGWASGMQSNGLNNVGVGTNAGRQVIGNNNTSLGNGAGNIANTKIYTSESIMLGTGAKVVGSSATKSIDNVIAIGKNTSGSASSAIAVGINAGSSAENGVAIGPNSNTSAYNGIALGSFSEASTAAGVSGYNVNTNRTDKYAGLTDIALTSKLGAVSVGNSTMTRQITGVAAGTNDTDAVNIAQLKSVNLAFTGNTGSGDVNLANSKLSINGDNTYIKTAANGKQLTISPNVQNITLNNGRASASTGLADASNVAQAINNVVSGVQLDIIANKGTKTGSVNLSNQKLTVTGGNGIRTDIYSNTSGQNLVIGLEPELVKATTKGIGLTGDTGSTGLKYLKDGDATFKVAGDGNLVTTVGSAAGVKVSVDSTKVKDLAVEAVTVSKANTIDNAITVTPIAGTNSKDYAIGIDTTKLAAKTNLAYTANGGTVKTVSLAKGLNFVNGTNTVATVDSDGKVSFDLNQATKDSINKSATAVGRTITLNADSGTGSSQSLSNGNVSFAVSGATGDYISTTMDGSAVKVSTKRATINSDANTGAASVTGADGLATAKNVASAINSAVNGLSQNLNISDGTKDSSVALKNQKLTVTGTGAATTTVNNQTITVDVAEGTLSNNADGTVKADAAGVATTKNVADVINKTISDNQYSWKLSANGEATTATVGKGDTVDFTGDTNITVDRNNKDISVKLNKNLTDMNSISLGNARGETIVLNGGDGSIKAGKAEFKDNVGAGSTITSDQLKFTNGATGANEATTTIALDTVAIQSGPNSSALTSKYLTFSDEDGNIAEGSAKGMGFQNAAGKLVQFTVDEITAGGNKIKEVAEGTADTDAVNVKQLKDTIGGQSLTYRANTSADTDAKSVKLSKGLDFVNGTSTVASVDEDGKVSFDLNTATKTQINTNTTDIATNTANIAHTIALADDNGTSTTAKSLKDGNVSFNIKGDNKFISTAASGNDVTLTVNEQAIKDAAKVASSFKVKANTHAEEEVKGGDTITFNNGDNIAISQTGKTFTIGTAKNITVDSVTAGNTVINTSGLTNGTTAITGTGITTDKVTVGGISIDKTAGINAGSKVISNVASGTVNNNATDDSNAANIGDVKQAVANLSQNLNITDGTNNGTVDLKNQKLNVAGANGVTATVNNQTITVGLDANTVNATTKGIGLTADTGSTGNKYLKDGDVSFAVTGDGNLVSTTGTTAGVKVAVDAAKVKDLAVAAVTVSKDTQADNPITVTPTAGTNSKDYAIGIDTTKLAAKTDLTYRANSAADANAKKISLSKGLNFVDGGSTVATVDNDGKVSFDLNTATKNQISTNTTNIATNTTDIAANKGNITKNTASIATNTAALARNISLGADTGTASSQSLSTADVAFNVKGATGDFISTNMNGNTVEISTTRATINSNATTGEASVTGNDGLATAKNVADAINKAADAAKAGAAWNITTNSSTTDKTAVKGGDTVDLVNGDNIEITQDGTDKKKITVATKKDITVDSVTANNKVTVGSGANKITLDGTDGSVTGKAFTGTTFTGTSFTGTSFTAGNTVINTNGLTNGTTAITGTGVTTDNVTVGGISIDKTAGINASNKVISNVASGGTTATNAANIGDVQNAVANLSQNLNITDGTHDGTVDLKNQKLNVAGANGVTAKVNNQTITVGLDADTVNATTKGIGLTADTGSTGNKYLKDGDVSFAVTGDGSLVSTSATAAGVKVAVNSATITAGTDGTITGPTTDGVATAKNVANAINATKKASKTEITANTGEAANATTGNVTLTSTTAADGHTVYDVKLNDKVTLGTGTNAVTIDGTTGAITGKTANIGGVTVNGTANTIGGLSNTTWNGTAVSGRAATEDQLKAATGATTLKFTGDVATNTGSVNLKDDTFGIKGDGKYISTDVNGKNVNLTVSEAEVKKSAVAAVTVSTDTTDANNPLTVTPTTSADGTTKDYKVTIDGTKIANKTNLSYKANNGTAKQVSLADGLDFTNGTLTTASIDNNGVVKYDVNTASITAGTDGTITGPTTDGVATAKNVADAINAAKKSSKTEITANTGEAANATTGNVTLTSTTAADGHSIYDVKLNNKVTLGTGTNAVTIDGTTGAITGKTATIGGVTVNGTANTIGGLSNTTWNGTATTGRAATEDQLKAVADAASSQTWNITADKAGTTGAQTGTKKNATVGKDETVELVAGDNLTINQDERKFTYSLNKDLAGLTSVSVGTGTTETIKLDGATGKITAKNATIGGVTIDGDNKHVTGLSNTTWNGTATTGRAATEDQLKAVADTAKTTTDAVNLKFSGDTNTSPGVVNLKDDTFNIVGDGKYVSTDANGKNLTVKVSEAEVKKSAVAAVTVSTDTTDANNPLTVTPTTSADGTTKDYKVTIDGTKIANKTNLSYKANGGTAKQVSLADGLDFTNGTLTTASIDDKGVVKYDVNTASITAGTDGTITGPTTDGVATAKNVADAINAAKKASKTEITANTGEAANATTGNVTLTSTTAADGHTIYDVKLNDKVTFGTGANAVTIDGTTGKATIGSSIVDGVNNTFTTGGASPVTLNGATGTITGKTANIGGVTVNGTANTIGGLSNTTWNGTATTGRAATENQLKAVADAAGSQTWEITADKKAGTSGTQTGTKENAKVGKDDKVSLIAGENLTVDQAGKNFTYSLNTDLVKMNSATFLGTGTNTTVITGDSITQTAGTQTNTSTAGGNTVADGTKSTETTAAGQVIKDGTKTNTSTVDENTIVDGTKSNKSTVDGNTITDGTNTTETTSSSVTVKDNAGNSTVITKDNITTGVGGNKITLDGTAGKVTIGSSIVDGVNNTFTTGGANAVIMNGAAGTVKTGTVTVTGGTTNDITGLSNTTLSATDFATKGRAATEEQLKAATGATTLKFTGDVATNTGSVNLKDDTFGIKGDSKYISTDVNGKNVNLTVSEAEVKKSAVAAVTVSTDTTDANNPLTVTPTASADGTTKDYKVTIDGTKIANKTNLSYKANDGTAKQVSLADGLNFKNGTLTTASIDNNGVVKYDVNTASITAGTDGTITGPTTDGVATAQNVADAINAAKKASKTEITANTGEAANATTGNVSLTSTTAADGHTIYDVKLNDKVTLGTGANAVTVDGTTGKATIGSSIVDGVNNTFTTGGASPVTLNGATGTITGKTANIGGVTVDGANNHVMGLANKDWTPGVTQAVTGRAATEDQLQKVSDAVGAGWKVNTGKVTGSTGESNGAASTKVASGEEVQFQAGNNLIVDQNGKTVAYSLNKALKDLESATFNGTGTNKTVITGDSITQTAGTQMNTSTASGNTVADGTKSTKTTADGQVIKDGTKTNTSTVDENTIVDGDKSNKTTVDSNVIDDGTGNVNTSNATSNTITDGTNTVATTSSSVTVKDNAGNSTVITKDNITTGVGANKIILDGAVGTIKTGTVTVTGGTTNDITGLSNTTVTATDFATKGRAATEEQLKAVGEQTWQITADKKTGTSGVQTGLKENAKVGKDDKVSLIAGENLTVDQAGKNFTYSLNTDLVKMNSATFLGTGTNTTVITGDSITQTAGTQTNTSTAGGNTIADGTKSTETTAAGQVIKNGTKSNKSTVDNNVIDDGNGNVNTSNATSNTITDGTNTSTITAGKATIGSSIVDGVNNTFTTGGASPVTLNGATGTITGKTANIGGVTVDGTNNHVMGLANKDWTPGVTQAVSGRAATEDQLQKVSDAVGAGWKVNTGKVTGSTGESNGAASTKVASGEEVQFQAGNNLIVDQNGKTVAYSLNKALKDLESATFNGTGTNKTVINGDSITQTASTQTNTSTAAGNTVADGTKSTKTTADGQVIKDGTKTNTSTADENTLVDGTKSNKTTVDSSVIDDGNGNINTSNATSNTITDGTNRSTVTAGKATIGSSIIDGVNNTFTTGGADAVTLDGATGTITGTTANIGGVTVNGTAKTVNGLSNTTWNGTAVSGRAATEDQLKAVGQQTWQITADKDTATSGAQTGTKKDAKVGKDDKVQLIAGENMTINQNERDFTFTLNKDLVKMNSATFLGTGTNKTVITGDSITQTAGTQTNTSTAAGNTVADGTKSTETTAAGQVIKDGTKTNTSTVDENTLVDGTKSNKSTVDGNTITDGTNTIEATASSVTVKDNAGNSTVITKDNITTGVGGNKITLDGTAGKATIGSSVVDGVNNTFTTGGASPITLNGATGTITGKTANIGGVTVDGTNNHVMGLANKDWTPGVTQAVSGRAATEDQLQKVSDAVGAGWKVNTGKVTGSTGESNGAASTKVASGEEVQFQAGNNLIVDQNGKTVAYSLNKALKDLESATFNGTGTNKTVINGDSITQTAGTQTNTSTAGGNTVADGTKSTKTTADGQVIKDGTKNNTSTADENTLVDGTKSNKTTVDSNVIDDGNGNINTSNATSNIITDGTNTAATTSSSVTVKDNAGNSTIITKDNITTGVGSNKITLDGTVGTIKTGTVTVTGGTTNEITGLSNTTVNSADFATKGRAATEEQLKAVGEQTWQITADKKTGTSGAQTGLKENAKVGKDDKVSLIAGENLTVDQAGKNFTYSLNTDLVKMNSATFEATGGKTTVIKGDSIVQTDGTKSNTATAAGNTVANGTKSTETTAAGQVIKDGAKSNKSTVDNNVIDDGTGNVNTSNATSNTVTDGTNTTATTSSSVTIKDNAGNSTVITKDNITTGVGGNKITLDGTAGKATIGSSIVDGVNNTFTTGGASPVTLNGATGTITGKTANIGGVTVDGTNNHVMGLANKDWTPGVTQAVSGRAATEDQLQKVSDAVGAGWKVNTGKVTGSTGESNGAASTKVSSGEEVQFQAGNNLIVDQNGKTVAYSLNKALKDLESATFNGTGTNKTVINGDSITQTAGTQTNTSTAGGNTVADGTKSTETTAAGQVIKDGTKTNTSTVDENTIVDGTKSNKSTVDGNTITDGTNTTETTSSSVTVKDNAGNSTVITKDNITTGVGGNKITLDGTAGKATIGTSVVDGVNNTFTTGGTNAVTMNGAAGTIKTGTVTVTGGTTNDITGLSNTTVNSVDFATKGRAATEEQLKAVGEQTWQITADKDTATSGAQTGTKKDAKVGKDNKVQLIAGENMTINQNERDFTFTLNKDLVKMNSATFLGTGSNTTVITGNSITQTAGTQTNTSTAGGNTVADGTKSTETTAAGQVIKDGAKTNKSTVDTNVIDDGNGNKNISNATSNRITDGTNTSTITAGKANIGNIAVDGVNNKITMGNGVNPVTLDGTNGHLDGLTNTTWVPGVTKATTGRAATEDQLQQVSDAVGAGWKVNTGTVAGSSGVSNGAASTKVSSGEEVKLQAGDNLVIDQNSKTVSYSLNKDLTKMNSATFEATGGKTTVIKGDSIVQTDGGKTNTSNAAGNTVVDGNKSTATTAAGTTITDGAKTNTSTADKNVINDGVGNTNTSTATSNTLADNAGNTNVSNATSNTLKNAAGDETKADAKGVTVKDAAGNNATFTKDGVTITKTGKDTVSLTSNGLDNGNNKIVNVAAGVANTDAVNVGQLKEYAAKSTTELTANNGEAAGNTKGNIVLTKTTAADGHTIYDNKLNDKITLGAADPTKAVTVDGTAGTIAVADKITLNGKDGKAGIGTVGIDGKDGIITTGGTNSVKVDGATGTVTSLTNKTWTPGSIVSGRAATEDQLKDAVADSGWKAAVDKEGSGQSTVVGTSPEKIKAEETVTFKAGNNMMVTQTGKSISYAINPELTDMKSATFKDAAGNTTVTNGNGITITPGSANPTNPHAGPVSLTKDGLNNGNNQIKGVAPGTDPTDAVNVSQLNASNANTSQAINQIAGEVQHVGAHAAAMAALKPIQYDPLEPTQVMAGVGNYRGETAAALGLAHYTNENTMFNVGVSVGGNHNMVNAGVTHKFGYSPEKKNIPDRYKAGPISSVYVMQDEVSSLKKENAEQKYVIADQAARLTTLEAENEQQRRELAETKKGLDDLKAAVDKLLASKG